ncbi:Magnesium-dependent phosphatase-1 [Plasmodiophora brassicae]
MMSGQRLIAFDLDGTIWSPEMYELWGGGGPPFRPHATTGDVVDQQGTRVRMLGDTRSILARVHETNDPSVVLAISSRTDEPDWAQICLNTMEVRPGIALKRLFTYECISKSAKTEHFRALNRKTGIPFSNMVFFDNEPGNIRLVSQLGVHCILTPDGVKHSHWQQAMSRLQNP